MTNNQVIFCDECKHEFLLNAVNIQEQGICINKQQLLLVYFTCPKCNKIYRVCLMDDKSKELKEDLEKAKKRVRRNRGSNNVEMASVLNNMILRKQNRLKDYMKKLNDSFKGTFTYAASENNVQDKTIIYLP